MHTIRDFLESTLVKANINFYKKGSGVDECYLLKGSDDIIVSIDKMFYRPAEVHELCGNPSLAEKEIGWKRKHNFDSLVSKMYENDYALLKD